MNMWGWIQRQWQEWSLRNSILVMLVPWLERGDADAVAALIPALKQKLRHFPALIVLDRARHHLHDALKLNASRIAPRRIVLFAHPTDAHDGFAVNAANDVDITVLRADWWMGGSPATIDLLVAQVCDGASVLRQSRWSDAVTNWISFDGSIDEYLGSDVGRECWTHVAEGVVGATVNGSNLASVTMRVHRVFVDELITVHDRKNYSAGDTINLCNLERALQLLVNSEENP